VKRYTPSPAVGAFFNALVAACNTPPLLISMFNIQRYQLNFTLPAVPPRPSDPVDAAFYDHVCMDLYAALQNALAVQAAAIQTMVAQSTAAAATVPGTPEYALATGDLTGLPDWQAQQIATQINQNLVGGVAP
jgi:hypothetical protein